jgi:hypothetical protein
VPFLATVPINANGPVPVIIFQHGLGRSKSDALAIADAAAQAGFGVIAIDAVLHGDRSAVINGVQQPSGTGFLNVTHPALTRDNFYQSNNDMYSESRLIEVGHTNFDGGQVPLFAPGFQVFVGQSLGGILGTTFTATEEDVATSVLNVPGGRFAYLINNSPTLGPPVQATLAAEGAPVGSYNYVLALWLTQTVLDDVDPFNYGPTLLNGALSNNVAHQVLVQEMIGDQVVPNTATTDLVVSINSGGTFTQINAVSPITGLPQASAPFNGSGLFQYTGGAHGFLLDPTQGPTAAAQTQALTFDATGLQGVAQVINPLPKMAGNAIDGINQTFYVDGMVR